jgi:hypothetical protein
VLAPQGFENGLHTHEPAEVFHVIGEEIALHVEEVGHLRPGETGYVAGGWQHGFRVVGSKPLRVLAVLAPTGAEAFFRAVGDSAADRTLPEPREVSPADVKARFAAGAEHGSELRGPLPTEG